MSWAAHPLVALLRSGASVSVNSDDPAVFATSLVEELVLCATAPAAQDRTPPAKRNPSSPEAAAATRLPGPTPPVAAAGAAFPEGGMGLSLADLRRMTLTAADAAFLPPAQKAALRRNLEDRFEAVFSRRSKTAKEFFKARGLARVGVAGRVDAFRPGSQMIFEWGD
jgi:hypothetical protein